MRILSITLLSLAICHAASATEVYRWTNEKGVTQYSDTPPANASYERVNVRTGTTRASEPETAGQANAQTTPPISSQAQVDQAKRAERCQAAQRNLTALRSSLEVTVEIEGEIRTLSSEEREQQLSQNERIAKANCEAQ